MESGSLYRYSFLYSYWFKTFIVNFLFTIVERNKEVLFNSYLQNFFSPVDCGLEFDPEISIGPVLGAIRKIAIATIDGRECTP